MDEVFENMDKMFRDMDDIFKGMDKSLHDEDGATRPNGSFGNSGIFPGFPGGKNVSFFVKCFHDIIYTHKVVFFLNFLKSDCLTIY